MSEAKQLKKLFEETKKEMAQLKPWQKTNRVPYIKMKVTVTDIVPKAPKPMPPRKVSLEYSEGSNEGRAIYLSCTAPDGFGHGFRVAGPKCWGCIEPIQSFDMDERKLIDLIREAKAALKFLQKQKKT